jgi:hypothetical protein
MSNKYTHHFSDRNIPFGIGTSATHHQPQAVTRLGDSIIFLGDCQSAGLFDGISGLTKDVLSQTTLNAFAALGIAVRRQVRDALQTIFQEKKDSSLETWGLPTGSWEMVGEVVMHMPFMVCDFVGQSCLSNICLLITINVMQEKCQLRLILGQTSHVHSTTSKTPAASSSTTQDRRLLFSTYPSATKAEPAPLWCPAQTSTDPTVNIVTRQRPMSQKGVYHLLYMAHLGLVIMRWSLRLLLGSRCR